MRAILIPVADRPECVSALDVAFALAKLHDANVAGCHVRPHRPQTAVPFDGMMPADPQLLLDALAEQKLHSEQAKALFAHTAKRHGFAAAKRPRLGKSTQALWHEMVGTPARILSIVGPVHDLAVVSRPKLKSSGHARAFLLAALLHSARPVLVLPQKPVAPEFGNVLVAWDQSPYAAGALHAAIPILQRAHSVALVSAGPENRAGPKSSYAIDYLKHWGVRADKLSTRGLKPEREIEHTLREVGAELLVMGAYSRSRLRELVFGGVTEHMLFRTEIPIPTLMLHP